MTRRHLRPCGILRRGCDRRAEGGFGVEPSRGHPNVVQMARPLWPAADLRHLVEHVGGLVDPATLHPGLSVNLDVAFFAHEALGAVFRRPTRGRSSKPRRLRSSSSSFQYFARSLEQPSTMPTMSLLPMAIGADDHQNTLFVMVHASGLLEERLEPRRTPSRKIDVEVGAVGRQETQFCASGFDGLTHGGGICGRTRLSMTDDVSQVSASAPVTWLDIRPGRRRRAWSPVEHHAARSCPPKSERADEGGGLPDKAHGAPKRLGNARPVARLSHNAAPSWIEAPVSSMKTECAPAPDRAVDPRTQAPATPQNVTRCCSLACAVFFEPHPMPV